jgi:hypothetical protein
VNIQQVPTVFRKVEEFRQAKNSLVKQALEDEKGFENEENIDRSAKLL